MKLDNLLNKAEAARYVGCTRTTFDAWVLKHNIPYIQKWDIYIFEKKDLDFLKKHGRIGRY